MNMKIQHSILIGIAIVVGFVLHAAISKIPDAMKIRKASEMQIRMMEMTPKEITVGDSKLLYLPSISYKDLTIDVDAKFFKYQDDKLIQVVLTKETNK